MTSPYEETNADPLLELYWANVCDVGPALRNHWFQVSYTQETWFFVKEKRFKDKYTCVNINILYVLQLFI